MKQHLAALALLTGLACKTAPNPEAPHPTTDTRVQVNDVLRDAGRSPNRDVITHAPTKNSAAPNRTRPVTSAARVLPVAPVSGPVISPSRAENAAVTHREGDLAIRARNTMAAIFSTRVGTHQAYDAFVDPNNGLALCRELSLSTETPPTQVELNAQRRLIPRNICSVNLRPDREQPLVARITNDVGFAHAYENATNVLVIGRRGIRRIDYIRDKFRIAFSETALFRFLHSRSPALAEEFVQIATVGISFQETGCSNGTVSTNGAIGPMQIVARGHNSPLPQVNEHPARRRVFGNRPPINPDELTDLTIATQAAALVLDGKFISLQNHFRPDSIVMRNPRDVFFLLIFAAYHHGQGPEMDIGDIAERHAGRMSPQNAYETACGEYLATRPDNYNAASRKYGRSVIAWEWLFRMQETYPGIDVHRLADLARRYPAVPEEFILALLRNSQTIHEDSNPRHRPSPLTGQRISTDRAAQRFLGSDPSQDQARVVAWLNTHDHMGRRFARGYANPASLLSAITQQINTHWLVNLFEHPTFAARFSNRGVAQTWRRVVRVDQIPTLQEIALALNEVLYENGMSRDRFVTLRINGAVRDQRTNRGLRGSSPTSAHLGFSAFDFDISEYDVSFIDTTGIHRFQSSVNLRALHAALEIAITGLAREEKLFARCHGSDHRTYILGDHLHIVPRVSTTVPTTRDRRP